MRGVNWDKVQEVLKEDLRLSEAVNPLNYAIELSVNVRDHEGAELSNFNGTVTIEINCTKSTDIIELHSNGLNIQKVELLEFVVLQSIPTVTNFSINKERETIMIHLNQTIHKGEEFLLQITYNGLAIMNEYGLYENWYQVDYQLFVKDPKFNKTFDTNGAFVLASNNYPTGARFWFPCFDEPQRKATFELRVNHPIGLNVYSNTEIQRTEGNSQSKRITSVFAKTHLLSTYQVTLSVNHFPVDDLGKMHGFKRVRVISSLNNPQENLKEIQRDLINRNLEHVKNSTLYDHFNGNLDIIILDGTYLFTVNPGLVTFGRYNYFSDLFQKLYIFKHIPMPPLLNFTNLIVGNQISVGSIEQLWLNDMFGFFYAKEQIYSKGHMIDDIPHEIFHSSLHERPLRDDITTFVTTTKQFMAAKKNEPALKASQLLKAIHRICPDAKEAFEKYLIESRGKIADIDKFVNIVSQACKSEDIRAIMNDFIDQPGRAFLSVTRVNNTVEIRQTRYLSSSFNEKLRDATTRYTIPIFINVDGKESIKILRKNETSLKFSVEQNSTFFVDYQYDRLYFVFYKDFLYYNNVTEDAQTDLQYMHRKSLLSGLEQSAIKYDEFVRHARHYINQTVFTMYNVHRIFREAVPRINVNESKPIPSERYLSGYCDIFDQDHPMSWDGLFNNDTSRYWQDRHSLREEFFRSYQENDWNMVNKISCLHEWRNASTYSKFLEKNYFQDSTQIRPSLVKYLIQRTDTKDHQWKELYQFFYRNANNFTAPRWDVLADVVLHSNTIDFFAEDYLNELRQFVIRNPRRAASMSNEIEIRMEKEFIRKERAKWHGVDSNRLENDRSRLAWIASGRPEWTI